MKPNEQYMEQTVKILKADFTVADLITSGGYLQPDQAKNFIVNMIKETVLMPLITVRPMKAYSMILPKIGFTGDILKPGTSGVALGVDERSKPTTSKVQLDTKLMKGQVNLDDETLEDNIEQGTFRQTILDMIQENAALSVENILVNGDTTSADPFLQLWNGMLASATSHVVNAGTVPLAKSHLKAAVKALPGQYRRLKGRYAFATSDDAEMDWADYLAERGTQLGDASLTQDGPTKYTGRSVIPVPVFPDNLGGATNCTNVLYSDLKNANLGIYRRVRLEAERKATEGYWAFIVTLRAGFAYEEEDAVVKITNVKTQ